MRRPHVLVLYNETVLPPDHPNYFAENDVVYTAEFVEGVLNQAGFDVSRLGLTHNPATLLAELRGSPPNVIFNLFEGTGDQGQNEAYLAGLLEWQRIPFTGCPASALALARNKALTKYLLQGAGLPTAPFLVVTEEPVPPCALNWPVIVKPCQQDASEGIDQGSVVTTQEALQRRVAALLEAYGPPVLVEEFIRGRELAVALAEVPDLRILTISETLFTHDDPESWPIVTYDAKWRAGTRDFNSTPVRYPAEVEPELARRLEALALRTYRLLGCRDCARVDFRVSVDGQPFILEVNPNPDFSQAGGLARALESAGLTHEGFCVTLVERALARGA